MTEVVKLCCVGCAGTHTLPVPEPIVFLCRVCGIVSAYYRGVVSYIETFTAYMGIDRESEVRAHAAFVHGRVAGVLSESEYTNEAAETLVLDNTFIDCKTIYRSIPHEDAHALWRQRIVE